MLVQLRDTGDDLRDFSVIEGRTAANHANSNSSTAAAPPPPQQSVR